MRSEKELYECSRCVDRDSCFIGRRLKNDLPTEKPSFDEALKDPYFLPYAVPTTPRSKVNIDNINDISQYFSPELRVEIINKILNNREPIRDSEYENPLFKEDLEYIKLSRVPLEINTLEDLIGMDYLEHTSRVKITCPNEVLDLRYTSNLKDIELNIPNCKEIIFPYVVYSEIDYENDPTYQLKLSNAPKLEQMNLIYLAETFSGIRWEDIVKIPTLKFLYIPSTMYNQSFDKFRIHENLDVVRLALPMFLEEGKYVFYLSNTLKGGYKFLTGDIIQPQYITKGKYDKVKNTITFDKYSDIPNGTHLNDKLVLIYNK